MPGSAPTSGDEYLLYIDGNSVGATPLDATTRNWLLISGQRTFDPKYNLGMADATDKDSNNNEEGVATNRSMQGSVEGVREEGDPGQEALASANKNRNLAYFKYSTPAGNEFSFQGYVTEYSETAPQDDVVTYSGTIKRSGPETEI